ncbi:hypothetical protein NSMS1_09180 [Nostoc sp. MS1]|nr:hypothetical protein NSMS1_09180 [Nostoc sp. MS1]
MIFALRIEVAAATLSVAASLSRAGMKSWAFGWCVNLVELCGTTETSIHEGIVLSHPSTHFWLSFYVEALSDWRYKIYSSWF